MKESWTLEVILAIKLKWVNGLPAGSNKVWRFMHQSIPSLTIPRANPGDSHVFTVPRVGFSPNFLCPEARGFESEKFSTVLKEKCRNFSICFEQFEKHVFLCCFISIFAKTVDVYSIFNNVDHFLPSVILIKFSGHPRVTFACTRSSLKF